MKRMVIIPVIFLFACQGKNKKTNPYSSILQQSDTLHIWYKFPDRISAVHKGERRLFNWINEVFNNKVENCSCETNGGITVYSRDSMTLDIGFATGSASTKGCEFLIIKEEGKKNQCYKLSYNLGRYLDDMRNFIKPE